MRIRVVDRGAVITLAAIIPGSAAWFENVELGQAARVAMYGALAVALGALLFVRYRGRFAAALGRFLGWLLIFAFVTIFYTFKDDFQSVAARVFTQLDSGAVFSSEAGEASVARRLDGEFIIDADINGALVKMSFDTGASIIELRPEDAERIGVRLDGLAYRTRVSTANGEALAAPVVLDEITVGGITERKILALVAKPGALQESLLGRSFLDRLSSYSVERSQLIMHGQ